MKSFTQKFSMFASLTCSFLFISCKVADEKPTTETTNHVFSYFVSSQYAFSNSTLSNLMTSFYGGTLVGSKDSTLNYWTNPILGCTWTTNEKSSLKAVRALNVGNVKIRDSSNKTFTISPLADHSFDKMSDIQLAAGPATLSTTTDNEPFATNQDFTVLDNGSQLKWEVIDTQTAYELPSPRIPADTNDAQFFIVLKRGSDHRLSFRAPADTTYVKVLITDGVSDSSKFGVVCYSDPQDEVIDIPSIAFDHFTASSDGRLQIDFVSISHKKDLPKIKESMVLTYRRHIHGLQGVPVNGNIQAVYFGALVIQ